MLADLSPNLSMYHIGDFIRKLRKHSESRHQHYAAGILKRSTLWQLRSDRMMYDSVLLFFFALKQKWIV